MVKVYNINWPGDCGKDATNQCDSCNTKHKKTISLFDFDLIYYVLEAKINQACDTTVQKYSNSPLQC